MRDPKRIEAYLEKVKKVWMEYPDWRFGQLVVNILGADPFYIEDEDSIKGFERLIGDESK